MEGVTTLEEVDRHWSLCDVADANDVLDAWAEAKAEAERQQAEQMKRRG